MAAKQFLLVSDSAAPLASGEASVGVMGLGRALAMGGAGATILALGDPEAAARLPGLARRLRTIKTRTPSGVREVSLYEGQAPLSRAQLAIVGATGANRSESAALLAEALRGLTEDGLLKADVAVAWGETAALALSVSTAAVRVFVIPSGRVGADLTDGEMAVLAASGYADIPTEHRSLAALGAASANAIVVPSASVAGILAADPVLAERASDEPFVPVRLGCDDPPHDPASDGSLPAMFSAKALSGKAECRRAMVRRHSLAVGPRTLLLGTAPLRREKGGEALLAALPSLAALDVAVLVPGEGDADLLERVRRLAIQSPGRLAVVDPDDAADRFLRAAADAVLFADADDRVARAPGLAQRYGAVPVALDRGAPRDYLVDYDPASATGSAILYGGPEPHEIEAAVRRLAALRASADDWTRLAERLIEAAPRWADTAAAFEAISAEYA